MLFRSWYASLLKPAWIVPDHWFALVSTILYVLMGTAVWLVSRERYHARRATAFTAYGVQLVLNALWAPLFFAERNLGAGLFDSVALWLATLWTVREFFAVRASAALLLLPYFAWVSYAMALNFTLWRLNQ